MIQLSLKVTWVKGYAIMRVMQLSLLHDLINSNCMIIYSNWVELNQIISVTLIKQNNSWLNFHGGYQFLCFPIESTEIIKWTMPCMKKFKTSSDIVKQRKSSKATKNDPYILVRRRKPIPPGIINRRGGVWWRRQFHWGLKCNDSDEREMNAWFRLKPTRRNTAPRRRQQPWRRSLQSKNPPPVPP